MTRTLDRVKGAEAIRAIVCGISAEGKPKPRSRPSIDMGMVHVSRKKEQRHMQPGRLKWEMRLSQEHKAEGSPHGIPFIFYFLFI